MPWYEGWTNYSPCGCHRTYVKDADGNVLSEEIFPCGKSLVEHEAIKIASDERAAFFRRDFRVEAEARRQQDS